MPELIELGDRERWLAKRLWQELDGATSLEQCEAAVQIVQECRRHGIDPATIIGPSMQTYLALEQAESDQKDLDRFQTGG